MSELRPSFGERDKYLDLLSVAYADGRTFRLPYEFAVPDLLFARELAGALGD